MSFYFKSTHPNVAKYCFLLSKYQLLETVMSVHKKLTKPIPRPYTGHPIKRTPRPGALEVIKPPNAYSTAAMISSLLLPSQNHL